MWYDIIIKLPNNGVTILNRELNDKQTVKLYAHKWEHFILYWNKQFFIQWN